MSTQDTQEYLCKVSPSDDCGLQKWELKTICLPGRGGLPHSRASVSVGLATEWLLDYQRVGFWIKLGTIIIRISELD